jgi:hypothetical protein
LIIFSPIYNSSLICDLTNYKIGLPDF